MKDVSEYNLKEIPFSSQGSESGKYPFVPSESFNELISEIKKIHNGDPSAIIVRGPQGSGKSATKYGLNAYFKDENVTILQVNLASLELRDLAWSIIDNAREQNLIDDNFIAQVGYEEGIDIEKSKLEKIIIKTLEAITANKGTCILIIDEFDVIAQPVFHDQAIQGTFLLNITNILNSINESQIIKNNSFCTILAQTALSSEEFNNYISVRNRPLGTRLNQHLIDIKYNKDETKKIIQERIKVEAVDQTKLEGNNLFPFTDEIIDWLFENINNLEQTESMEQFRTFEQILRTIIEKSLENDLELPTMDIVKEIFNDQKSRRKEKNVDVSRMDSLTQETRNAINASLMSTNGNDSNILYLNGIKTSMQIWEEELYSSVESNQLQPVILENVYISGMKISIKTSGNNPIKKNFIWYSVSKIPHESFTEEEFDKVNEWLEQNKTEQLGSQRVMMTVFDDSPIMNEEEVKKNHIKNVDRLFFRDINFKRSIIAIGVSNSNEERDVFRGEWDSHLHTICATYLGNSLYDIGRDVSKTKHVRAIQYLYLNSIVGNDLRRDDLQKIIRHLTNTTLTDTDLKFIKSSGFIDDELNCLIPRNFKSLETLIELNTETGLIDDDIDKYFGNEHTIKSALNLKAITDEKKLFDIEVLKHKVSDIIDEINNLT